MKRLVSIVVALCVAMSLSVGVRGQEKSLSISDVRALFSPAGDNAFMRYSDALQDGGSYRVGHFKETITLAGTEYDGVDNPGVYLVREDKAGKEQWAMACKGDSKLQEWVVWPDGRVLLFISYEGELIVNGPFGSQSYAKPKGARNLLLLLLEADGASIYYSTVVEGLYEYEMSALYSTFTLRCVAPILSADGSKVSFAINANLNYKLGEIECKSSYCVIDPECYMYAPGSNLFTFDVQNKTFERVMTLQPIAEKLIGFTPTADARVYVTSVASVDKDLYVAYTLSGPVARKAKQSEELDNGVIDLGSEQVCNTDVVVSKIDATGAIAWSKSLRVDKQISGMNADISRIIRTGDQLLLVGGYQAGLKDGEEEVLPPSVKDGKLTYTDYFMALVNLADGKIASIKGQGFKLEDNSMVPLLFLPKVETLAVEDHVYVSFPFDGPVELAGKEYDGRSKVLDYKAEKDATTYNGILVEYKMESGKLPEAIAAFPLYTEGNSFIQSLSVVDEATIRLVGQFSAPDGGKAEFAGKEYPLSESKKREILIALAKRGNYQAPLPISVTIAPEATMGEVLIAVGSGEPVVFKGDPASYPQLKAKAGEVLTINAKAVSVAELKDVTINGQAVGTDGKYTIAADATEIKVVVTFAKREVPISVTIAPEATMGEVSIAVGSGDPVVFKGDAASYPQLKAQLGAVLTIKASAAKEAALKSVTVNGQALATDGKYTIAADATEVKVVATFEKKETPGPGPSSPVESVLMANARVLVNPFSAELVVVDLQAGRYSYTLFNAQGQCVLQGEQAVEERLSISTDGVSAGLYVLRLVDAQGITRGFRVMAR